MPRKPSVFISHKHSDRNIADVLRSFMTERSLGKVEVFQSSCPLGPGPRLGHVLNSDLLKSLCDSCIVLLVYTTEDQDWSYCMWECGIATRPGSLETKIILLQCASDVPAVFEQQVRVDVRNKDDVTKFVKEFLVDPDFFPGVEEAVAPNFTKDDPAVGSAASDLFHKLAKVIPKGEVSEWSAQPFVRLELKTEDMSRAVASSSSPGDFQQSSIVREMSPSAWNIFGIANADVKPSFSSLVERWARGKPSAERWVDDLRGQVLSAAGREIPTPAWTTLQESQGTKRYTPVLTRIRQVGDVSQFDVSLVQFEKNRVLQGIGDPHLQEYLARMNDVEAVAQSLTPYLTPVAGTFFHEWSDFVKRLVTDGEDTWGPDRLEITKNLVRATKKHILIERLVENPLTRKHSRDWIAFYEQIGGQPEIDKTWVLCVQEDKIAEKQADAAAAWKFFSDRKFKTLFCSPQDLEDAIGETLPAYDVIEIFGDFEFVKYLTLPGGSYTADDSKNILHTILRVASPAETKMLKTLMGCSKEIGTNWLQELGADASVAR